jgi:hypothetical protein
MTQTNIEVALTQAADEVTSSVAERKRKSPEEPLSNFIDYGGSSYFVGAYLERDDGNSANTQVHHGEAVLASEIAAIEKP